MFGNKSRNITVVPAVSNLEDHRANLDESNIWGCLGKPCVTQADNQWWKSQEGTGKRTLFHNNNYVCKRKLKGYVYVGNLAEISKP